MAGCSESAPPPPTVRVVEATVGADRGTIDGWSECVEGDSGRTIVQVHGSGGASFSGAVDEATGEVNWLSYVDDSNGIRLETKPGDLTATRTGETFRVVSSPGYPENVDITVTCST